jgi:hypothetical protein
MFSGVVEVGIKSENLTNEIEEYRKIDKTFHDHLPFLWYEYEKQGYLTMFQEDAPSMAIYNYLKNGFRYKPTDLYVRPFWVQHTKFRNGKLTKFILRYQ